MSPIVDGVRQPTWPQRLLGVLASFNMGSRLPEDRTPDIGRLSDRQLRDIGVSRPDIGRQINRDMEELRRKGIGPFV